MSQTDHKERKVSYSQSIKWEKCPLSWKLEYVDKHKIQDASLETVFGDAIHKTIQHWLTLLYGPTPKQAKLFDMEEMFKDVYMDGVKTKLLLNDEVVKKPTKTDAIEYFTTGIDILTDFRRYIKDWFSLTWKLVGTEISLDINLKPGVKFIGYIDIIMYDPKEDLIYIYDFKTSKSGWSDYTKKDTSKINQILLYKKFYSEQFDVDPKKIIVKFIILKRILPVIQNQHFKIKRITAFEPAHGSLKIKQAVEKFENFINTVFTESGEISNISFPAIPSNSNCKFCKFKSRKDLCSVGIDN